MMFRLFFLCFAHDIKKLLVILQHRKKITNELINFKLQ